MAMELAENVALATDGSYLAEESVTFQSVLYEQDSEATQRRDAPDYFRDLNLDQIVDTITARYEEHDLKSFFYGPLTTIGAVEYRYEIMRDLEVERVFACICGFTDQMRLTREHMTRANKLHYQYQRTRWFLQAVDTYCAAVREFSEGLAKLHLSARGLVALREYVASYLNSNAFCALCARSQRLRQDLDAIEYLVAIRGGRVTVLRYNFAPDYSAEVLETFKKFRQAADTAYEFKFSDYPEMNHVEAKILDCVANLYPEVFSALDDFFEQNQNFADATLARFDREVHFYIAYLELVNKLDDAQLSFCYPVVSSSDKNVYSERGFDLALAILNCETGKAIVPNDFHLIGAERTLVVTGPNQGGKTTFARTFGQLHHLAVIGCPVPGTAAQLLLFDSMFTHFERGENIVDRRGKLQDDLLRIHAMLGGASPRSILIINEIFSSTTLGDALLLARSVMKRIADLDLLCVCVTFLDELASLSDKTVSMVSTVAVENPAVRTYKVLRRPADGRAYAISLAEKYGLTYDRLKTRIPS